MNIYRPTTIFKTFEGEIVVVPVKHALLSEVVEAEVKRLEPGMDPLVFSFPVEVDYEALKRIKMYLTYHQGNSFPSPWDLPFISDCANECSILKVLHGANFMSITSLVELCLKKIAACLRNKTLCESRCILERLKTKRVRSIASDPAALNRMLIHSGIPNTMSEVLVEYSTLFILRFNITSDDLHLQLPLYGGHYVHVDWGDTQCDHFDERAVSHRYDAAGKYDVRISGDIAGFGFGSDEKDASASASKLIDILQWGCVRLGNQRGHFAGCINLMCISAEDTPDLSDVTNLGGMFERAIQFKGGNMSNWDVSNVTNMESMFCNANSFRDDLSNWDVSNVTDMESMFARAYAFDSDLSKWNVSCVTDMHWMFAQASAFTSDVSQWDVSSVKDMSLMFYCASAFDGDLSQWNVGQVTHMDSMFAYASSFHSDLSKWNVSSVVDMGFMFARAYSFNSELTAWDVSGVKDMSCMFWDDQMFQSDLSNWIVTSVQNMSGMFSGATAFQSDLSLWDVSSVTRMQRMFEEAFRFNSDLSEWNVQRVTDVSGMFYNASSFSCNMSKWNIYRFPNTRGMLYGTSSLQHALGVSASYIATSDMFDSDSDIDIDSEIDSDGD